MSRIPSTKHGPILLLLIQALCCKPIQLPSVYPIKCYKKLGRTKRQQLLQYALQLIDCGIYRVIKLAKSR